MIDLVRARHETPGCFHVAHFNNAGASLPPIQVSTAVRHHLDLESHMGGYEAEALAEPSIENVYDALAQMLGCDNAEIAFLESATRAWDMAFYALPFRAGDRILTGMAEYASNYIALLQVAQRTGAIINVVPDDEYGQISVTALRAMIDERVKLIALTHVPTNGGLVNPAAEVGKVAREAGILYLLDACQSAGQMPLNVMEIGCDMLSATGRKYLRGPRGTGFLYIRQGLLEQLEPPMLDMHAADWVTRDTYAICPTARRFECWESSIAGKIGLGVAVDYALSWGLDAIQERVTQLAEQLRAGLRIIPGVQVQDLGRERCGIVTFTLAGWEPEAVREALAAHHINVWRSTEGSTRLDMEARGLQKLVRASVHYYNSEEEVEQLLTALTSLITGENPLRL